MGEYFDWINVDKKEYLSPSEFNLGNKRYESTGIENDLLRAVRDLLSTEWQGCRIMFFGDECEASKNVAPELFQTMIKQTEELSFQDTVLYDVICESYKNVAGLFQTAEKMVKPEIEFYLKELQEGVNNLVNEYGVDINAPYKGLFSRKGKTFKYTINHSKKTAYSLGITKLYYQNGKRCKTVDPLPVLMGYGRSLEPGIWLGDIIGVDDVLPTEYTLIKEMWLDW